MPSRCLRPLAAGLLVAVVGSLVPVIAAAAQPKSEAGKIAVVGTWTMTFQLGGGGGTDKGTFSKNHAFVVGVSHGHWSLSGKTITLKINSPACSKAGATGVYSQTKHTEKFAGTISATCQGHSGSGPWSMTRPLHKHKHRP